MKHHKKNSEKKRETWTFQPSDDVKDMVKSLGISAATRGERSRLLNDAMRNMAKLAGASERAAIFRELAAEFAKRADKA